MTTSKNRPDTITADTQLTAAKLAKAELRKADALANRDELQSELDDLRGRIADALAADKQEPTRLVGQAGKLETRINAIESRLPALEQAVAEAAKTHEIEECKALAMRFTAAATRRNLLAGNLDDLAAEFEARRAKLRRDHNTAHVEANSLHDQLRRALMRARDELGYPVADLEYLQSIQQTALNSIEGPKHT